MTATMAAMLVYICNSLPVGRCGACLLYALVRHGRPFPLQLRKTWSSLEQGIRKDGFIYRSTKYTYIPTYIYTKTHIHAYIDYRYIHMYIHTEHTYTGRHPQTCIHVPIYLQDLNHIFAFLQVYLRFPPLRLIFSRLYNGTR